MLVLERADPVSFFGQLHEELILIQVFSAIFRVAVDDLSLFQNTLRILNALWRVDGAQLIPRAIVILLH